MRVINMEESAIVAGGALTTSSILGFFNSFGHLGASSAPPPGSNSGNSTPAPDMTLGATLGIVAMGAIGVLAVLGILTSSLKH